MTDQEAEDDLGIIRCGYDDRNRLVGLLAPLMAKEHIGVARGLRACVVELTNTWRVSLHDHPETETTEGLVGDVDDVIRVLLAWKSEVATARVNDEHRAILTGIALRPT